MKPAQMSDAELASAAGEASDAIGRLMFAAENERQWLQVILREIAERAGVAPRAEENYFTSLAD